MTRQGNEFDLGDVARAIVVKSGPEILYAINDEKELDRVVKMILEEVPAVIGQALAEFDENRVEWAGLGSFILEERRSRKGRNFQTGETVEIPARDKIVFNTSPKFAEVVEAFTGRDTY